MTPYLLDKREVTKLLGLRDRFGDHFAFTQREEQELYEFLLRLKIALDEVGDEDMTDREYDPAQGMYVSRMITLAEAFGLGMAVAG